MATGNQLENPTQLDAVVWAQLCAKFDDGDLRTFTGRGGNKFTYADARAVQTRLDEVVGAANWSTSFCVLHVGPPETYRDNNGKEHDAQRVAVECTLTVFGVVRADCGQAYAEDEPFKAAYTDSFRRAAAQFGIARYLYEHETKRGLTDRPATGPRQPSPRPPQNQPPTGGVAQNADSSRLQAPEALPEAVRVSNADNDARTVFNRLWRTLSREQAVGAKRALGIGGEYKLTDVLGKSIGWIPASERLQEYVADLERAAGAGEPDAMALAAAATKAEAEA